MAEVFCCILQNATKFLIFDGFKFIPHEVIHSKPSYFDLPTCLNFDLQSNLNLSCQIDNTVKTLIFLFKIQAYE